MTKNFSIYESGTPESWKTAFIPLPDGGKVAGKAFVKDKLNATGCEISINSLAPGQSVPFVHAHKENEEVYIFLQGQGQMQVDGETFAVGAGTMVRIAPAGMRIWRNTSADEQLLCLVLQVRENSLNQYSREDGIRAEEDAVWPA
jgi:mannose-6-phosphate isomerase-like protein (cupin superfamily)